MEGDSSYIGMRRIAVKEYAESYAHGRRRVQKKVYCECKKEGPDRRDAKELSESQ